MNTSSDPKILAGKVVKSSLLGRDPWGDQSLPVAEPAAEGNTDGADTTYTAMQTLLESVQDQTWLYLKTHVKCQGKRILEGDLIRQVIDEDLKYRADTNDIRRSSKHTKKSHAMESLPGNHHGVAANFSRAH